MTDKTWIVTARQTPGYTGTMRPQVTGRYTVTAPDRKTAIARASVEHHLAGQQLTAAPKR